MEQNAHCIHEQDWGDVKATVERLDHDINGNGKKGLRDTVTELNINTENLAETVKGLTTSVNALIKFQTETTAEKLEQRRKTLLAVTLIMVCFSVINYIITWSNIERARKPQTYMGAPAPSRY